MHIGYWNCKQKSSQLANPIGIKKINPTSTCEIRLNQQEFNVEHSPFLLSEWCPSNMIVSNGAKVVRSNLSQGC
jgi:hypothetical protein